MAHTGDFVSMDLIIDESARFSRDAEFVKQPRGFYAAETQRAVEEIALDTKFERVTKDIELDQANLSILLPDNCFKINEIHLHNGECCDASGAVKVFWKRLYNNRGSGEDFTASYNTVSNSAHRDPFFPRHHSFQTEFFANINNNLVMFSPSSKGFRLVRLMYHGYGGALEDAPVIPRFFRQYLVDFVCESFFRFDMVDNPRSTQMWQVYDKRLNDRVDGSKRNAKLRVGELDGFKKETLDQTLGRFNT